MTKNMNKISLENNNFRPESGNKTHGNLRFFICFYFLFQGRFFQLAQTDEYSHRNWLGENGVYIDKKYIYTKSRHVALVFCIKVLICRFRRCCFAKDNRERFQLNL